MTSVPGHSDDLSGRTALVTGAGSGIGRACAVALAHAGATVHLVDRDGDSVTEAARETGGTEHVVDLAADDPVDIRSVGPSYQPTRRYRGMALVNRVFQAVREYF